MFMRPPWYGAQSIAALAVPPPIAWTPDDLAVAPRLWLDGRDATFSGSNLATWPNRGDDGGFCTAVNGPTAGAALNGLPTVNFAGATSQHASIPLSAWGASGEISWFALHKLTGTTWVQGLFNKNYPAVEVYSATSGTSGTLAMGNGTAGFPTPPSPFWDTTVDAFNDTNAGSFTGQLGATNAGWKNSTAIAIDSSGLAAFPSYGAATWVVGCGGGGEALGGDLFALMLFDYFLTTLERQKIEGYYHWLTGTQALLPGGHPYASAPPVSGGGVNSLNFSDPLNSQYVALL